MRARHPGNLINVALRLVEEGRTHREVADATGISIHTIRTWLYKNVPDRALQPLRCPACGAPRHDFAALPPESYAYLLGVYLGDGCLGRHQRDVYSLRVALDDHYPAVVAEVSGAIRSIRGRPPLVSPGGGGKRYVIVLSYWKQWPCLFPQHGPGRKHHRPIVLEPWQQAIVDEAPEAFLRGLIHTDGWRGVNRVTVKGRDYAYPRYQFSNRSDDIRTLFTDTCDMLGIEWRPWGRWHVSVAKRASVARMDEFIGPKT